ncbi:MAG: HD domain-containing protein [Patescibacteria group bacterium]|nr:HD domain-containing protein [Patescibacteria group bacterium]
MKKKTTQKTDYKPIADFLYEVGILAKTPRSGFHFLGSGHQSVAEHLNRVGYIGYVLAMLDGTVDPGEVVTLCLFHDLGEARTSDLNYVHQKYANADENKAIDDLSRTLPFGDHIRKMIKDLKERTRKEALLAKDADQLEWILSLKEQADAGNTRAKTWIPSAVKRLRTEAAQELAPVIQRTPSDDWWFSDKNDKWWITRNKQV